MEPIVVNIAGVYLKITPKFCAGHVLSSNEAVGLNSALLDNIRSNFTSRVKIVKNGEEAELSPEKIQNLQKELDEYAKNYTFAPRRAPRLATGPILKIAKKLAEEAIKTALRKKNADRSAKGEDVIDVKSLSKDWWEKSIFSLFENKPELIEEATRRHNVAKNTAMNLLNEKPE